ncbi:MAG: hypothetical protein L3J44_04835 [Campylobacteraceae bacterium]|nr:hypothetical protein [Campylobacteraceae bacterium]
MKKIIFLAAAVVLNAKEVKLHNQAAYITSECYTKTVDKNGGRHNPCYACHINSKEPNYTNDIDLQASYDFPEYATKNHWSNLFKDRSKEVAKISDKEIIKYVREDNYKNLSKRLKHLPQTWDVNHNGKWDGFIPDCNYSFDKNGFDRDKNRNITGWVAFSYRPFLGTFWPTNGSTDDVLIRLPEKFRKDKNGKLSTKIYKENLNILKEQIRDSANNFSRYFVGLASKTRAIPRLYPKGTEFLHSVRYIDIKNGKTTMAKRMKELRYAKKVSYLTYSDLKTKAGNDYKQKDDFPDRLEVFRVGNAEKGLYTKTGWFYEGFIEDKKGELRPQNYEESLYCIGCHSGIGATTDSTFAFPRVMDWKWMGIASLIIKDKNNEYRNYLLNNHSGDEFRANDEVKNKFFKNNKPRKEAFLKLKNDISYLLFPSPKRAINLDKAYKVIVDEQSYIYGKEGHIKPLDNIYKKVEQGQGTQLKPILKR